MENVFDYIWRGFSDILTSLDRGMPVRNFDFDKVSEHDKQIIRELSQRIVDVLFFSEVDDGKATL